MASKQKARVWVALAAVAALQGAGCAHYYTPLTAYTRTEDFHPEHAAWLERNCDLVSVEGDGRGARDRGNYLLRLGQERQIYPDRSFNNVDVALLYACPDRVPWPHEDIGFVRHQVNESKKSENPRSLAACGSAAQAKATYEIFDEGTGERATATSYVRFRVTPIVKVAADSRERVSRDWGIVAGARRSWEDVNHVPCSQFAEPLAKLRVGGKAHVSSVVAIPFLLPGLPPPPPAVAPPDAETAITTEWDIELLAVGAEDMLWQHVGLER